MSNNTNRGRLSVYFNDTPSKYMPNVPEEWQIIGVIARNNDQEKGALLKNKETGIYAMGNFDLIQPLPQHKISAIMEKENKTADPYWNKHRLNKKSIQAYLNEDELKKIKHVLDKRGFKTYKEMIIQLCDEEISREK